MVAVNRFGEEPPLRFYGSSFICDPYGRMLVQAPRDEPAVLVAELDLDQRRDWLELFPFLARAAPRSTSGWSKIRAGRVGERVTKAASPRPAVWRAGDRDGPPQPRKRSSGDLIDLHTHILPGLDDGALDLSDSLAMGRVAAADGIRWSRATPHVRGDHDVHIEELPERRHELQGLSTTPGSSCASLRVARCRPWSPTRSASDTCVRCASVRATGCWSSRPRARSPESCLRS